MNGVTLLAHTPLRNLLPLKTPLAWHMMAARCQMKEQIGLHSLRGHTIVENNSTEFTFHMDLSIPDDECFELLNALSAPDVGAEVGIYGAGPMEEFMAAVGVISTAISAAQIAQTVVQKVIRWRQRMQQKGISPKVVIERRGNGSINLEVDADETITIFITKQITESHKADSLSDKPGIDPEH
jgi:hypothetical protein